MSSPSEENQRPALTDDLEKAPAVEPTEARESKDKAAAAAQQTRDGSSSAPNFAFDKTLLASAQQAGDTAIADSEDEDEEVPYPEQDEEAYLLPPPDFKPLFTLIEDSTTGVHHHPTVHYLFADDDPDILTEAALETVSDEQQEQPPDERIVIVDMSADGREVLAASSLSPDWQALRTKVTQAPSWGEDSKTGNKGLMLRISGQEAEVGNDTRARKGDVEGLLKEFDEVTSSLDGVLGSSTTTTTTDTDTQVVQ